MKKIVCEMCGSSDFMKSEGVYVCLSCGMKYSATDVKNLMVDVEDVESVKVSVPQPAVEDHRVKIENLLVNIERAYRDEKFEQVQTLCMQVLNEDVNNVRAILYEGLAIGWSGNRVRYTMNKATSAASRAIQIAGKCKEEELESIIVEAVNEIDDLAYALIKLCINDQTECSTRFTARMKSLQKQLDDIPLGYGSGAIEMLREEADSLKARTENEITECRIVIEKTVVDTMEVFEAATPYFSKLSWENVTAAGEKVKEFLDLDLCTSVKKKVTTVYEKYNRYSNDNVPIEVKYDNARDLMKKAKTESDFLVAGSKFNAISEYKDSAALYEQCKEKAETTRKNTIYKKAKENMNKNTIVSYTDAMKEWESISGWKDADKQKEICKEKIEELKKRAEEERIERERLEKIAKEEAAKRRARNKKIAIITIPIVCACIAFFVILGTVILPTNKYNKAVDLMENKKYQEAVLIFEGLGNFKDSQKKVQESKYLDALQSIENEEYVYAYDKLQEIKSYKDSEEKIEEIFEKYKVEKMQTCKVGDTVFWGAYEQDNNLSNGKEKIEWLVLEKSNDKVLLISKYALICSELHDSFKDHVTWDTCKFRPRLNNEFVNEAFSKKENACITITRVEPDENPQTYSMAGNAVEDKLFILSISEVERYFENKDKTCEVTPYAMAGKSYSYWEDGKCAWTLRTAGSSSYMTTYVDERGFVNYKGHNYQAEDAIRPAMWLDASLIEE